MSYFIITKLGCLTWSPILSTLVPALVSAASPVLPAFFTRIHQQDISAQRSVGSYPVESCDSSEPPIETTGTQFSPIICCALPFLLAS